MSFVLDTDAIVHFVKGDVRAVETLSPIVASEILIVPSIVVTELWSSAKASKAEMDAISVFLDSTLIMPLDRELGKAAGELRRDHRLSLGDCVVAATALAMNATLLTRNVRDFKKVPALILEEV